MNGIFEAALEMQTFCQRQRWRFCIIGGVAVIRWGEPQATQDVDVSLLTGFGSERTYLETLLDHFATRAKDWAAVEGVLARQQGRLDWTHIDEYLPLLCDLKGEPESLPRLAALRQALDDDGFPGSDSPR